MEKSWLKSLYKLYVHYFYWAGSCDAVARLRGGASWMRSTARRMEARQVGVAADTATVASLRRCGWSASLALLRWLLEAVVVEVVCARKESAKMIPTPIPTPKIVIAAFIIVMKDNSKHFFKTRIVVEGDFWGGVQAPTIDALWLSEWSCNSECACARFDDDSSCELMPVEVTEDEEDVVVESISETSGSRVTCCPEGTWIIQKTTTAMCMKSQTNESFCHEVNRPQWKSTPFSVTKMPDARDEKGVNRKIVFVGMKKMRFKRCHFNRLITSTSWRWHVAGRVLRIIKWTQKNLSFIRSFVRQTSHNFLCPHRWQ